VRGLDQLSRTYLVNLMTFQAWGLIYAILQVLMSAVNLSSIDVVLNSNGVLNSFVGSSQMVLLAFTTSIFSLSIALIPFIASRIVRGDVGSTMMTMVNAMTTTASAVAGLAAASIIGVGEGAHASQAAGGGAAPSPPPGGSGVASLGHSSAPLPAGTSASSVGGPMTPAIASTSLSPTPPQASTGVGANAAAPDGGTSDAPSSGTTSASPASPSVPPRRSSTGPGQYRGFNVPHAVAWYVGYSLGSAYRGVKGGDS